MDTTAKKQLKQAIKAAKAGERAQSRVVFRELTEHHPQNYRAWLWRAYTAETIEEKRAALRRVVLLRPGLEKVEQELSRTESSRHFRKAARAGVFISYSRADELFAVQLAEDLRSVGVSVWIDVESIPVGADWYQAVDEALSECGLMLFVISPEMLEDETIYEYETFVTSGKLVIPLLIRDANLDAVDLTTAPIDFRESYMSGIRRLIQHLDQRSSQASQ